MLSATSTPRSPFVIARTTITSPEKADAPRTLRDLHVLHALGAILNKRTWWIKWATQPRIQTKWLTEIEDTLVRAYLSDIWTVWPERSQLFRGFKYRNVTQPRGGAVKRVQVNGGFDSMHRLQRAAMATDNEQLKRGRIERVLADVMYPPGHLYKYDAFDEGASYDSNGTPVNSDGADEDDEDEENEDTFYAASAIDTDFDTVLRDHQGKNAFGHIAWYVAMAVMREELRSRAIADWTRQKIADTARRVWSPTDTTVTTRTCALILRVVRRGPVTLATLRESLPDEQRSNVLILLQLHFSAIRTQLEAHKQDICGVLAAIISVNTDLQREQQRESANGGTCSPGPAPHTWLSDHCVPEELKRKFCIWNRDAGKRV